VLDVAVADLRLTATERGELLDLAADLGLNCRAVARAHREFFSGVIDPAVED
jgi:DNA polymerase-3 subunit epsilon